MASSENPRLAVPVELRDPTIGRLLASRWGIGAIRQTAEILRENLSAQEFTARLFAALARKVPEGSAADQASYKAGIPIDRAVFAALSSDALDCLAGAYLKTEAASMVTTPRGADAPARREDSRAPRTPDDNRMAHASTRPVERLLHLAKASVGDFTKGLAELSLRIRGVAPGGAEAKASLARTSLLSSNLAESLSPLTSDGGTPLPTSGEMPKPAGGASDPDRGPTLETEQRLAELWAALDKLAAVGQQQAELARALTETTQIALQRLLEPGRDAAKAFRRTRNGVRLAAAVLLVAIVVAAGMIVEYHHLIRPADVPLKMLAEMIRPSAASEHQNATTPEALHGAATEGLAKTVKAIDTRLETLTETLRPLTDQQRQSLTRLVALQKTTADLTKAVAGVDARLKTLTGTVRPLADQQRQIRTRFAALQDATAGESKAAGAIDARLQTLTTTVQPLAGQQRQYLTRLNALRDAAAGETKAVGVIGARLRTLTATVQPLAARQRQNLARLGVLQAATTALTKAVAAIDARLDTVASGRPLAEVSRQKAIHSARRRTPPRRRAHHRHVHHYRSRHHYYSRHYRRHRRRVRH